MNLAKRSHEVIIQVKLSNAHHLPWQKRTNIIKK